MMTQAKTHAQRVVTSYGERVYLVKGTSKGQPYWCIIMVDKSKMERFLDALGGRIHLQHFGKILKWGFGKKTPDLEEYR